MNLKRTLSATVGMLLLSSAALSGCAGKPKPAACKPTYVYNNVKDQGSALDVLDLETAFNGTGQSEDLSLTAQHSHSVSVEESNSTVTTFHAAVNGSAALVAVAGVFDVAAQGRAQAVYDRVHETDSAVTISSSLSTGSVVHLTVAPGATAYGLFGVVMKVTNGDLQSTNCTGAALDSHETFIIPTEYEWCTWTRGPDDFTDGGLSPCVVVAYDLSS
jgi:hypothetical protein